MKQNDPIATNEPMSRNQAASSKKMYHKPAIETYGKLADITESKTSPVARHSDGTCWVNPGFTPGRT